MKTWLRCYWDEEDIWFYFELDPDGQVIRQVELQGPDRIPNAAASLGEWQHAQAAGRLAAYETKYGLTALVLVSEWEGYRPEWLASEMFEEVWDSARRQVETR